jgi:prolyl-tRNA editing enzyme YbaK/EbsC (Cys-tRNA(Pro) deacylase)
MSFVEQRIKQILKSNKIEFEETEHEAVYHCEEAALAAAHPPEDGVKSMIFRTKEGKYVIVLNPGNKKIDTKRIAELENTRSLYLASPEDVEKVAGVPIGCIPPFGHRTKLKTYLSQELLRREYVYFNPGAHTKTVKMKSWDLLTVLENPKTFS